MLRLVFFSSASAERGLLGLLGATLLFLLNIGRPDLFCTKALWSNSGNQRRTIALSSKDLPGLVAAQSRRLK